MKAPTKLAVLVTMFLSVSGAIADKESPKSTYTTKSPGGEYLFVMLSPYPFEDETRLYTEEWAKELRGIQSKYSESGLYRNDGSADALWTVDWFAHKVEVSADGIHLVRWGPWSSHSRMEAVSFFANGKLLKSYRINQLVDLPFLMPRSASHFRWAKSQSMNDTNKSYELITYDGGRFGFDIASGEIVTSFRTPRWGFMALVVISSIVVWRIRKMQNKPRLSTGHKLSNRIPITLPPRP